MLNDPLKILLVDDESGFTRLLKLTLEKTGKYIVQEVNDARKALYLAREFVPDLILLDIVMPEIDGGDVAQQIKNDAELNRVPIVFLTAIVSEKETASRTHIEGYPFLAKPVSLEALTKCIEENIRKK